MNKLQSNIMLFIQENGPHAIPTFQWIDQILVKLVLFSCFFSIFVCMYEACLM